MKLPAFVNTLGGCLQDAGEAASALQAVRQRILRILMLVSAAALLTGCLFWAVSSLQQGNLLAIGGSILLAGGGIFFALYPRLTFSLKAYGLLASVYALGLAGFIRPGIFGDGKLYLLGLTLLAGLLFGFLPGLAALGAGLLTTAGFGFGLESGLIIAAADAGSPGPGPGWITATAFLAALGGLTLTALAILVRDLQASQIVHQRTAEKSLARSLELERLVKASGQEIERRIQQMRHAYDITRLIATSQDLDRDLSQVVEQMQADFDLYYAGIFLVDDFQNAVLRYGSGEAGKKLAARGHRLPVGGSSMIGWCIANRAARIALDTGAEAVRFNNPDLPDTRSELALPVISRGSLLGAITIQSSQPNAFDENDIRIFQGIADSLAVSLDNARLIERAQASLRETHALNQTYLQAGWEKAISNRGELSFTFENDLPGGGSPASTIQFPMTLRDQQIGEVTLETGGALSQDDLEFIDAITTQTALALENARLIDETQRKVVQEETVSRLSAELWRGLNIEDLLASTMQEIRRLPSVADVSILLDTPTVNSDDGGLNPGGRP